MVSTSAEHGCVPTWPLVVQLLPLALLCMVVDREHGQDLPSQRQAALQSSQRCRRLPRNDTAIKPTAVTR
jgi:hypothetical protein